MIAAFRDGRSNLVAVYVDWRFAYLADHGPDDRTSASFWPDYALSDMPWTSRQLDAELARALVREFGDGSVLASSARLRPSVAELDAELARLEAEGAALGAAVHDGGDPAASAGFSS